MTMDMGKEVLIFLSTFDRENPSMDEKTDFIIGQTVTSCEYFPLGEVYDYMLLPYNDPMELKSFISKKIKEVKPKWIVAEGTSSTALMGMKIPNRILVNPRVEFEDLNNVPDYVRKSYYGFFDKKHEKDYERCQSVYPNSSWYPETNIELNDLKLIVEAITKEDS